MAVHSSRSWSGATNESWGVQLRYTEDLSQSSLSAGFDFQQTMLLITGRVPMMPRLQCSVANYLFRSEGTSLHSNAWNSQAPWATAARASRYSGSWWRR